MRISHREIIELRADLKGWVAKKKTAAKGFMRAGYAQATRLGIYKYHRVGNLSVAQSHLSGLMDRLELVDQARRDRAEDDLKAYHSWWRKAGRIYVQDRLRLGMILPGNFILGGDVPRIDFDSSNETYHGVLLGTADPNWKADLRTPILQAAIANRLSRDVDDIRVGVQSLDGSGLDLMQYSAKQVQRALDELERLLSQAARLLAK